MNKVDWSVFKKSSNQRSLLFWEIYKMVDLSYLVSWLLKQRIVMATYFGESCHTCRIHIRFRPWHSIHSWGDSSAGRGCTDSECDAGSRQPITDGCLQSEAIDGPKRKIASARSNGPWHVWKSIIKYNIQLCYRLNRSILIQWKMILNKTPVYIQY